jgi:hypothetical protein
MKIVISKLLKDFIDGFDSQRKFCQEFDIDPATLNKYLDRETNCSSTFIAKVKDKTGMDFEKAFEVKE